MAVVSCLLLFTWYRGGLSVCGMVYSAQQIGIYFYLDIQTVDSKTPI